MDANKFAQRMADHFNDSENPYKKEWVDKAAALVDSRDSEIRAEALKEAAKSIIDEAIKLSGRDETDAIEPVPCKRWWWKYSQSLDSMLRAILAGEVKK
jgi:hypothetical protein